MGTWLHAMMRTSRSLTSAQTAKLLERVRSGSAVERQRAADRLLPQVVAALPAAVRAAPIDQVQWSQSFATNGWWRALWRRLGVARVDDLATVGRALARARGVGCTKLAALLDDLVRMANDPHSPTAEPAPLSRLVEAIRHHAEEIKKGPSSPNPHHVTALFQAVVAALPQEMRGREIDSLPWASGWCYNSQLWSTVGVAKVADLARAAAELARVKGIGRGKVLTLADELTFLGPDLHARLRSERHRPSRPHMHEPFVRRRTDPEAGTVSIVDEIDRLIERLEPRERDVMRRRIGWRYSRRPETLRTLAEQHGVTQERIRQIEGQLRQRLGRLLRLQQFPQTLHQAVVQAPGPVPLETIIACGRPEFQGMMGVWRPLAALLEDLGGPYLLEDHRDGAQVVVSLVPSLRTAATQARRGRSRRNLSEPRLSWPTPTPGSTC
jgi:hypothetical protein